MSTVTVIGEEIHIAVDDPSPVINLVVSDESETIAVQVGIPGEKGENGPAYVANVLAADFTVPADYTAIRGRTKLNSGVKIIVELGAVLKLI